jgi:putative transposase
MHRITGMVRKTHTTFGRLLMSNYRRANTKGGTYFFIVVTYRRQRFLCDEMVRNVLHNGIKATQATRLFTIDAWVLLPDHLHTIWGCKPEPPKIPSSQF